MPHPVLKQIPIKLGLVLSLMFVPCAASASIFDPIVEFFLPLYEKIAKKPTSSLPDNTQDTQADSPVQDPIIDEDLPKLSIEQTLDAVGDNKNQAPDLLALLQAEFAYDRGDPDRALKIYKTEAMKQNATAVFERALTLSMQMEPAEQSLAFASAWQSKNPDHTPAWFYATHLAVKAGDFARVSQNLNQILEYDPKVDIGKIFEGILPADPEQLRILFGEIQSLSHENTSLSVLKAALLYRIDEPVAALLHLNDALKHDPNNLAYHLLKADILGSQALQDDKTPQALSAFLKKSIASTTGNTKKQLVLYYARHLLGLRDFDGAFSVLKREHTQFAQDPEYAMLSAVVALDVGDNAYAKKALAPMTRHSSTKHSAYYYLGVAHERDHEYDAALINYQKVHNNELALKATQKIVALFLAQSRMQDAIDALKTLRRDFEIYATDSYLLQAQILVLANKADEAKALLAQAYDLYPDEPELLYVQVKLLDDTKDADQKKALLAKLLDFDPSNLGYRLEQAKLTLAQDPHDAQSLDFLRQLQNLSPADPDYSTEHLQEALTLLATHALLVKDYAQVLHLLETPYAINPNPNMGKILLQAYQAQGNDALAQKISQSLKTP